MKNDKITFVSFFDENIVDLFLMNYESINKLYADFEYFIGVSVETKKIIEEKINDERIKIFIVDDFLKKHFDENSLFGNITIFTYARFFTNEIFNKKFPNGYIFLDVDIMLKNKIRNEFLNKDENYAIINSDNSNKENRPVLFWDNHLKKKALNIDDKKIRKKIFTIRKKLIKKMENSKYFNAGVLIINKEEKLNSLVEKIFNDSNKLFKYLDDQTLLNFFNKNEIRVLKEESLNFKIGKSLNFSRDTEIVHFLGANKHIMKRIYNNGNFDWDILLKRRTNLLNFTLICENEKNADFLKDKIDILSFEDFKKGQKPKTEFSIFIRNVEKNENFKWLLNKVNSVSVCRDYKTIIVSRKKKLRTQEKAIDNYGNYSLIIPSKILNLDHKIFDFKEVRKFYEIESIRTYGIWEKMANLNLKFIKG